jgi:dTDP-4-dehydrorhamnose 3,5-epimerase
MTVDDAPLPGVKLIRPVVHRDARGTFAETYHYRRYVEAGLPDVFVQDNYSRSVRGTIRGLHAQLKAPQAKLVRVVSGAAFDVAVDIRAGSPTFGRWFGTMLTGDNFTQMYIPAGFAHGFEAMSDVVEVEYKCSALYDPHDEIAIRFDDPAIGITWHTPDPIVSPRDVAAPSLAQIAGVPRSTAPDG